MQITYKKRHTKNLGNFENLSIEIGIDEEVDFEAGETFETCYERIRKLVNDNLKKEFDKVTGKKESDKVTSK